MPQLSGQEFAWRRRAYQEVQGVLILRHQLHVAGDVPAGGIHLRLRAIKVQFGRKAKFMAPFDQVVGALLRLEEWSPPA